PMDVFHEDQAQCRDYADNVVAGDDRSGGDVIAGAVVGATLGALLGSAVSPRHGAAPGAIGGAMAGAAVAGAGASRDRERMQHDYDDAYERCMYAHDDILPGQDADDTVMPPPPPGRAPIAH
ncbi:MAG TPA: hypothetical protein VG939_01950, partial [Caulobacteraceae bacterium]|nr:hypothetical protein [Caulobacteraceae bacterium]